MIIILLRNQFIRYAFNSKPLHTKRISFCVMLISFRNLIRIYLSFA